ncbi:hypothetical protein ACEPAF_947 [Sanghuangporus sanghuang]
MAKHHSHAHRTKEHSEKPPKSSHSHHRGRENSSSNQQTRWTPDDEVVVFEEPDDDVPPPPRRQTMPEHRDHRSRSRHGGRDRSLPRGPPVKRTPIYEQSRGPAAPRRTTHIDDNDDGVPSRPRHSRPDSSSHRDPPKRSSQPIYKEPWGSAAPRRQTIPEDYLPEPPPPPPPPMHYQQGFVQVLPPSMHHQQGYVQVPPSPMHHQQGFVQVLPPSMHHQQGYVRAPYPPTQVPAHYTGPPIAMEPRSLITRAELPTKERFNRKANHGDSQHTQELPVGINVDDLADPRHGYMSKGKVEGIEKWIDKTEEEIEEEQRGLH